MLRILEILVEGVILYLLYKFVVRFVIPTYRTITRVRKQMKEMQSKMNNQARRQQQEEAARSTQNSRSNVQSSPQDRNHEEEEGEYIDYEEVK